MDILVGGYPVIPADSLEASNRLYNRLFENSLLLEVSNNMDGQDNESDCSSDDIPELESVSSSEVLNMTTCHNIILY